MDATNISVSLPLKEYEKLIKDMKEMKKQITELTDINCHLTELFKKTNVEELIFYYMLNN